MDDPVARAAQSRQQAATRIALVVLLGLCVVGLVATSTLRMTVLQPRFYTTVADRTDSFERIYDEVLVDPKVTRFAGDLTARQPAAVAAGIGVNVRLVLPPDTVRAIVAEQVDNVVSWFNGSTSTLRLDVSLDPVLAQLNGAASAYVSEVLAATPTLAHTVPEFGRRLDEFLAQLRTGVRPTEIPTVALDAQDRAAVEALLTAHVPPAARTAVHPTVHAALLADDLDTALAAVGVDTVAVSAHLAGRDLSALAHGRTWELTPVLKQAAGPDAVRAVERVRWWAGTPLQVVFWGSLAGGLLALLGLARLSWTSGRQRVAGIVVGLGSGALLAAGLGLVLWWWLSGFTGSSTVPAGWPGSIRRLLLDNARTALSLVLRTWFLLTGAGAAVAAAVALGWVAVDARRRARGTLRGDRAGAALSGDPAAGRFGRLGPATAILATPVALLLVAGVLVSGAVTTPPDLRCNGAAYLCARRYDEVATLATHNAMANTQDHFLFPLQDVDIDTQLDAGARALQLDSWTWETPEQVTPRLEQAGFTSNVVTALSSVLSTVNPSRPGVWLCHSLCRLGALPIVAALQDLRGWLQRNPREVVTIILQDETPAALTVRAFEQAGLVPYLAVPPSDPADAWPTLGEMIASGHRLVAFTERAHHAAPWLQNFYTYGEETPFSFRSPATLRADSSCVPNRGGTGRRLFLLNHFVTVASGSRAASAEVNSAKFLTDRLRRCAAIRGRPPTVVAVDFASLGQAQAVVDRLNRQP